MCGIEGDDRPGAPAEPFEEIVGVPRPAPQSDVADRTFVHAGKPAQLGVGHTFADDCDDQQADAGDIGRGRKGGGIGRRQAHGQDQYHRGRRLDLQEDEKVQRPRLAPLFGHGGVARIVATAACPVSDM